MYAKKRKDLKKIVLVISPPFLIFLCFLGAPAHAHPFSHQKLIPYGEVQLEAFEFTHDTISFSLVSRLPITYRLPANTHLTIRRLRPHPRILYRHRDLASSRICLICTT